MAAPRRSDFEFEIAHVLFMDVVGYSKLLGDEQREALNELNQIVRETEQFRSAEAAGKLIRLPTGDGMALAFFTSPEAPIKCALEISAALKNHPHIHLRMGIHSGPVSGVTDVNDRSNVAGVGINLAQRVMDCGDAGHILLSSRIAEDLMQYSQWRELLHDLGECEVKHGRKISLVNFYTDEAGNPQPPQKCLEATERTKARGKFSFLVGTVIMLVAAILGFVIFHLVGTDRRAVRAPPAKPVGRLGEASLAQKSIAVLPFVDLSEAKDQEYFCDGIAEELLNALSQVPELRVVARTSSFSFKGENVDVATIARTLGVQNILEGSLRREGNRIRVTAQLVNAANGFHIWSDTFERELQGVFAVQDEITRAIVDRLKLKLAVAQSHQAKPNTDAYDLYLRGRYFGNKSDEESLEKSLALFQQAVAKDSRFADAWASLASAYLGIADVYRAPLEVLDPLRHAARMAVENDPDASAGHVWLGAVAMLYDRDAALAKRELSRAVELDPNSSEAWRWHGWYLSRQEANHVIARQELERARSLDPVAIRPLRIEMNIAIVQGDYDGAMQLAKKLLQIDPKFFYEQDPIAQVFAAMGRWQDVVQRYESLPASILEKPNFALAAGYAYLRQVERARQILGQLEAVATRRYVDRTLIAAVYAALGDKDRAFAELDRACDDRSAKVSAPRFNFWLAPLFADARFASFEYKVAHSALSQPVDENQ